MSLPSVSWAELVEALSKRDAEGGLEASDLELLGTSAYLCGREEVGEDPWIRAHQLAIDAQDWSGAARVVFWIWYVKASSNQMAVAGGWLSRGQRLLDERDPDGDLAVQGWYRVPPGLRHHHAGEFRQARAQFASALEIARRHKDRDLMAVARQAEGRAEIGLGHVEEGVRLLDEAMVAVLADAVSPIPAGITYCSVIEACRDLLDIERAREWTDALTRWCGSQPDLVLFRGRCSIHRSEIRLLGGDLDAALQEAESACTRLADPFHAALGAAHCQLGDVHRARGELAEAAASYRDAAEMGAPVEPGPSLLHLASGDVEGARRSIAAATTANRGPLDLAVLAATVEIALAGGDENEIRTAASALDDAAERLNTPLARARSLHWRGAAALAVGDFESGVADLRATLATWSAIDVPLERAATHALLETAVASLPEGPGGRDRRSPLGLSRREVEVLIEVAKGATNREVADALFIAERTVARHVSNIFTKLGVSSRTAAAAIAHETGLMADTK